MKGVNDYRKGLWTEEEDKILLDYIEVHGRGQWNRISKMTSLKRCGKSCRLRWMNYLSPTVKRGDFSEEEDDLIIRLHNLLGNRWSLIAGRVPGRTDNQVKNHWNTRLCRKLGVKKEIRKPVGSSKTHITQLSNQTSPHNTHQVDSDPFRLNFNSNNGGDVDFTSSQDPTSNGTVAFDEQSPLPASSVDSLLFSSDYLSYLSPGFVEFLDEYSNDSIWQWL